MVTPACDEFVVDNGRTAKRQLHANDERRRVPMVPFVVAGDPDRAHILMPRLLLLGEHMCNNRLCMQGIRVVCLCPGAKVAAQVPFLMLAALRHVTTRRNWREHAAAQLSRIVLPSTLESKSVTVQIVRVGRCLWLFHCWLRRFLKIVFAQKQ